MESILSKNQIKQYKDQGFLILNHFISTDACNSLIHRAHDLIENSDTTDIKTIFSTKNQQHAKQNYFLESGDKIRFFFEDGAIDKKGDLKFPKLRSINKIGHALHILDHVYHRFSYSQKIAQLMVDLNIEDPRIIQSMYICKQSYIGGEVTCHQDSTYLFVKEEPVLGFWFALENATLENGCLWAIPGGHRSSLKSRMLRKLNNEVAFENYDNTPWELDKMVPLEVSQGSLILLHGLLPHMSKENKSPHSRHAYTLHFMSGKHTYAKDNWLQNTDGRPFVGFK